MGFALRACVLAVIPYVLLPACSGGKSDQLSQPNEGNQLACLTTLDSYCCGAEAGAPSCTGTFAAASQCSSWPAGLPVYVYPNACEGLKVVRVVASGYSTFYFYGATSSTLVAIGDNAASLSTDGTSVECGAGPNAFEVPASCGGTWLADDQATPCSAGTAATTSVCEL